VWYLLSLGINFEIVFLIAGFGLGLALEHASTEVETQQGTTTSGYRSGISGRHSYMENIAVLT
jgi:hypothetical protein